MSDKTPSNPQVFPITEEIEVAGRRTTRTLGGLTLRDYLAGQALAGIIALGPTPGNSPEAIARTAYRIADAMLKEREEP